MATKKKGVSKPKAPTRKASSSLDAFLAFLKKNFILVALFALLPVTALAYQYNLANQSSASQRKNTLKFQSGNFTTTRYCASDECAPEATMCEKKNYKLTGDLCKCVMIAGDCDGGHYAWNCTEKNEAACPITTDNCREGDQRISTCGDKKDGSQATCQVCQNGQWSASHNLDCPDDASAAQRCSTGQYPTVGPQPTTGSQPVNNPPVNNTGGKCVTVNTDQGPGCWCENGGWKKHYCANWGKPDQYCSPDHSPCD